MRYTLDNPANWPRDGCNPNAYTPLSPVQPLCICKFLENLHHHHLENNCHCNDSHKQFVGVYSLEDILFLKLPCVELIEDLAKHKSVEDQCVLYLVIDTEDCFALELEDQEDCYLIHGLRQEVPPHDVGNERCCPSHWRLLHEFFCGFFGGKSQSSKCVHNQVYPQ